MRKVPAANANVLVIDDMPTMRAVTKKVLKLIGVKTVIECEDGRQGLSRLKSGKVDLVICDWDMPVMTGYELLATIKQNERLSDIPFIMLTANASKELVVKCFQAEVDDYVVKPFQPQAFVEKVGKFIALK